MLSTCKSSIVLTIRSLDLLWSGKLKAAFSIDRQEFYRHEISIARDFLSGFTIALIVHSLDLRCLISAGIEDLYRTHCPFA